MRVRFTSPVLSVMRLMGFLVMTRLRRSGKRYLPKKVSITRLSNLVVRKTAIRSGCRAGESFSMTMVKTGGVEAAGLIRRQSVIRVVLTAKCFMISGHKITQKAMVSHTLRVTVVSLWKLATRFLCSIDGLKMAVLSHLSVKTLTLAVA